MFSFSSAFSSAFAGGIGESISNTAMALGVGRVDSAASTATTFITAGVMAPLVPHGRSTISTIPPGAARP